MATHRETLNDGSVRLRSESCTFIYTRLRPSVLLVSISGQDNGEFGSAPLLEIQQEFTRYRQPVELFVDATEVVSAAGQVSDEWAAWFLANQKWLKRVEILAPSRPIHLTISIAKHLSRTGQLIRIHSDPREFETTIGQSVPGFVKLPARSRATEKPSAIHREVLPDSSVRHWSERCTFVHSRLRPGVVLLVISGHDTGEFGTAPLDEVAAEIAPGREPVELFVDTTEVVSVAGRVTEEWTTWFIANQDSLRRVNMLTGSQFLHLKVTIASHLAGTGGLISVFSDPQQFDHAIARAVPGYRGRSSNAQRPASPTHRGAHEARGVLS